jgi:predicted transposase YbfD/YdcC
MIHSDPSGNLNHEGRSINMEGIFDIFKGITDPRSWRNQKHSMIAIIGTSLLASLSGIDSFSGFADFTEAHFEDLNEYFEFPNGVPSHDTYQRFWDAMDPTEFNKAFREFTEFLVPIAGHLINIDGKTIRHSGTEKAMHIVSAWCHENQVTLAQERVDQKSNEITAVPNLLKLLDLKHRIVTLDAMGMQKETCEQIITQGGDYVISLKGNQGTLHKDVMSYFNDTRLLKKVLCSEEIDKGHGRLERRIAYSQDDISWIQDEHAWPGLKSIGMVESIVEKGDKVAREKRFYLSSLPADARLLNKIARAHWGIENQLHWRLDVVFNEDGSCIRNDNAAENMDILRKWALNIAQKAKSKPDQSIKSVMRKNAMSFKHLSATVKKIFHA